jgi:dihydropteroate synthase
MQKFPKIMGILNITEDSFSDGGDFLNIEKAVDKAIEMIDSGVDIIDIGAESTRPGAKEIPEKIELERVSSVVKKINTLRPSSLISVDTTKYEVARTSLELGAGMLNDISGLRFEPRLAQLCEEYNVPIILMHMKGEPKSMQSNPIYENVVSEVYDFLRKQKDFAFSEGATKVLVDVGIGFGKNDIHNKILLKNIGKFNKIAPQTLGISRKSFIGRGFGIENPKERDMATMLIHSLLLDANIEIIRVHHTESALLLKNIFNYLHP